VNRWLITGAGGQLGTDLKAALVGEEVQALGRADLDIADSTAVTRAIEDFAPDIVVNAAAYTAVDAAESDEEAAYRVNAAGPGVLATALAKHGGRLIHVSTDYVFAGDAQRPYDVDDPTGPTSAYGRTKLAGEVKRIAKRSNMGFRLRSPLGWLPISCMRETPRSAPSQLRQIHIDHCLSE